MFSRRRRHSSYDIAPEEIFLDSSNLPVHESSQFEGRIERPLSRVSIFGVGVVFAIVALAFGWRAFDLQVARGATFSEISRDNSLESNPLFAQRGVIYDRTGERLAWNEAQSPDAASSSVPYALRQYIADPGFADLLGFLRYPKQDQNGVWWRDTYTGISGLELQYNTQLSGVNGSTMIETDAHKHVIQQNITTPPQNGEDLHLTIDAQVQAHLYSALVAQAHAQGFRAGAGIIMDVRTGELLAITTFPQYDNQAFTDGDASAIEAANNSSLKPLLDRAVGGLYAPGSIMKTIFAAGALDAGIISPEKQIDSIGAITIPNPYDPTHPTVFHDWTVHGWIDMRTAIAVSSDEYFYTIGGGYGDQKGLGVSGLYKYAQMFGIGSTTGIALPGEQAGVIPSPQWKAVNFPDDPTWRLGDTYHTGIGQYGFQITPIQAVVYASALANGGKLFTPQLLASSTPSYKSVPISDADLEVVREGMRLAVTSTRRDATVTQLNIPGLDIAAKTGTAQIGTHNQYVNSWSIGFWPADNPHYAYAAVLEQGPASETAGAAPALAPFFEWLLENHPEYIN
ncbi:MAG TPA: penicillin-binding transpeptidase domain-containing protein [Candidatus Paceibacterota bacterium]|nr:penicillin-binding transpeptidase domain-containing protein [Candidatus Paceibacterota bacterium]